MTVAPQVRGSIALGSHVPVALPGVQFDTMAAIRRPEPENHSPGVEVNAGKTVGVCLPAAAALACADDGRYGGIAA
ncbi:hypothetical protein AWC31_34005 [Mycolicibacterium wolinskyi]|uniref:Uncharacterized protein n=1 Tax=Mycolicibacterium wolinskyi TaxID=59750 RepID=A0A1X2EZV1_9MYCO|nr:hypothetical protein AWC31_34005 [Mycolicibacterium wolinskyi]